VTRPAVALFLGASSMFATMYSTQAILPELESGLGCSAAAAGLLPAVMLGLAMMELGIFSTSPPASS
jgi:hypothetical protein